MRKVWYHQIWIQYNLGFMVSDLGCTLNPTSLTSVTDYFRTNIFREPNKLSWHLFIVFNSIQYIPSSNWMAHCARPMIKSWAHESSSNIVWSPSCNCKNEGTLLAHLMDIKSNFAADSYTLSLDRKGKLIIGYWQLFGCSLICGTSLLEGPE